MSLIWYSEMRTKLWLARRERRLGQSRLEAALRQARKLHHICESFNSFSTLHNEFGSCRGNYVKDELLLHDCADQRSSNWNVHDSGRIRVIYANMMVSNDMADEIQLTSSKF
jgi:hypothetical protein